MFLSFSVITSETARSIPFPANAETSISAPAFFLFASRPLRLRRAATPRLPPRLFQPLAPFRFRRAPKPPSPLPLSSFLRHDRSAYVAPQPRGYRRVCFNRSLHSVSGERRNLHLRSRFLPFCVTTAPLTSRRNPAATAASVSTARSIPFPASAEAPISAPAFFPAAGQTRSRMSRVSVLPHCATLLHICPGLQIPPCDFGSVVI